MIEALEAAGIKPRSILASRSIVRVFFPRGLILNCMSQRAADLMGDLHPVCGIAFVTHNPSKNAQRLARFLETKFNDDVYTLDGAIFDDGIEDGKLAFVRSSIFSELVLLFRRHAFAMGKRPKRFTWKRLETALAALQ